MSTTMEEQAAIKAKEVFPDLQHKMSKKIAQLTKVIYHLNTKNEDRQYELEEVRAYHQKEMKGILNDAAAKIQKFKDQLEKRQNELNTAAQVQKLQEKHAKEKEEALTQISKLKKKVAERETKMQQEFGARVSEMAHQLTAEKESFSALIQQFTSRKGADEKSLREALSKAKAGHQTAMEGLKAKQATEMADCVRKGNEKFSAMLTQQLQAQEALRQELTGRANEARRQILHDHAQQLGQLRAEMGADRETSLQQLRRQRDEELKKVRSELLEKLTKALDECSRLQKAANDVQGTMSAEQQALTARLAKLQEGKDEAARECLQLKEELAAMGEKSKTCMDESGRKGKLLEGEIAQRENEIEKLQAKLTQTAQTLQDQSRICDEKEAALLKLTQEHEAYSEAMANELAAKDGVSAALRGELEGLNRKMEQLSSSGLQQTTKLQAELKEAQKNLKVTKEELAKITLKYKDEVASLEAQLDMLKRESMEAQRLGEESSSDMTNRLQALYTELKQVEEDAKAKAAAAAKRHEESMLAQAEAFRSEMADLEAMSKGKEQKLQDKHEKEVMLMQELAGLAKEREASAKAEIGKLKVLVSDSQAKLEQALRSSEESKGALGAQKEELRRELESLKIKLNLAEKEAKLWSEKTITLKTESASAMAEAQQRFDTEMSRLAKEMKEKLDQASNGAHSQLEKAAFDADQTLKAELKALEARLTRSHQARVKELSDEMLAEQQKAKEQFVLMEKAKEESRAAHSKELNDLRCEMAAAVTEAEIMGGDRLSQQKQELLDRQAKMIADMEGKHAVAIARLKSAAEHDAEQAAAALIAAKEQHQEAEHKAVADAMREAAAANAEALAKLRDKHQQQMSQSKADADAASMEAATKLSHIKLQLQEEEAKREGLNTSLMNERASKDQLMRDLDAAKRGSDQRERALFGQHAREMKELEALNHQQQADQDAKHEAAKGEWAQQLQTEQQRTREWEKKFIDRPSRDEDILLIRDLQNEVAEKESLVRRAKEEMAYFKRELLNREEMYNKKFNSNPVVGVMQVVKGSGGGSSGSSVGSGPTGKGRPPKPRVQRSGSFNVPSRAPVAGGSVGLGGRSVISNQHSR